MPADHAHLAPQKLYTVREDHVLPARTRAEKARRNEESGDANVAKDTRAGGPQLAEPDLHCIQDVFAGDRVKYRVAGGGGPSTLPSPGLSALSSTARLLLRSVLQEARAGADRSQGVSPQTSPSPPRLSAPEAAEVPASTGGPGPWARSSPH